MLKSPSTLRIKAQGLGSKAESATGAQNGFISRAISHGTWGEYVFLNHKHKHNSANTKEDEWFFSAIVQSLELEMDMACLNSQLM